MNRAYVSTAHFNAPYAGAQYLHGLGATPGRRMYLSTANFRAPYDKGYFQDNTLMGIKEDLAVVTRQIPTWMFAVAGVGLSYVAYKKSNKKPGTK